MHDRRRNFLILLLVAGLLAGSLVAILLKPTVLGLDLKGGVSLVYKAKPSPHAKVDAESLNSSIEIMRTRVDKIGVSQPEIQRYGKDEIYVALPNFSNTQRAEEEVGKTAQMYFYDWETNVIGPGGKPEPENAAVTGGGNAGDVQAGISQYEAVQRAAKRPAELRSSDTTWTPGCTQQQSEASTGPKAKCIYGEWYLLDTTNKTVLSGPTESKASLTEEHVKAPKGAKVEAVHVNPGTVVVRARPVETAGGKVTQKEPEKFYVLKDKPVLTGADVKNPQQSFENAGSGSPDVTFEFTSHGAGIFERVTKEIAKRGEEMQIGVSREQAEQHFAIVLDEQLITVPRIDYVAYPEGIPSTNGSEISGGFTITSAQNLAGELQSGALPLKLEKISTAKVSATLGKEALGQAVKALLIGFAVVCIFLLVFYRVLGLIAIGGLAIYAIYLFALIKLIPVTMTLPSIAGVVLTIGVAADANIVIFERVKEEIRSGRSVVAGIAAGYKRGFAAIIDANVVTFMTAFILFALATAEVQGFAFMLGIGTLVSLFTAVLATQAALGAASHTRAVSHPSMLGAGRHHRAWKFDFMGASRWFFSMSGVILLVGALAIGGRGLNFGFDFTGGTVIETGFTRPVSTEQVRAAVSEAHYPGASVQQKTSKGLGGSGYVIKVQKLGPAGVQKVKAELNSKFAPAPGKPAVKNFSFTAIGPSFGETIADAAVIAIIASLLVISVYIALRFEWKYAVPVLIALMHDLLITSGIYALTGREVTSATVAALLTILGYSLYDTIIVFDRIRENVPRMPRAAFSQIVNRSMSEVLTRSLATSLCTLLPVAALLIFGGTTLQDFAFALLVGIASGAYSSIFIASPVLTHWKEREPVYRNRRLRLLRDFGHVPAYATGAPGAPVDVEPASRQQRPRRRGMLSAEEPGEQLSKEEFDELVRDLDVEAEPPPRRRGGAAVAQRDRSAQQRSRGGRQASEERRSEQRSETERQQREAAAEPEPRNGTSSRPAERDRPNGTSSPPPPAADAEPEDVVLKDDAAERRRGARKARQRGRKHGRSH